MLLFQISRFWRLWSRQWLLSIGEIIKILKMCRIHAKIVDSCASWKTIMVRKWTNLYFQSSLSSIYKFSYRYCVKYRQTPVITIKRNSMLIVTEKVSQWQMIINNNIQIQGTAKGRSRSYFFNNGRNILGWVDFLDPSISCRNVSINNSKLT